VSVIIHVEILKPALRHLMTAKMVSLTLNHGVHTVN